MYVAGTTVGPSPPAIPRPSAQPRHGRALAQVPRAAIDPGVPVNCEAPDRRAIRSGHLDPRRSRSRQIVGQQRSVGRILPAVRAGGQATLVGLRSVRAGPPAVPRVGRAHWKECRRIGGDGRECGERCDVVENPEPAPVRCDEKVVRLRLDAHVGNRDRGHVQSQAPPMRAAVARDPNALFESRVEHIGIDGILSHHVNVLVC